MESTRIDTLIIGAGPAAIQCAITVWTERNDFLVLDQGSFERTKTDAHQGFGGAMLYGDGQLTHAPNSSLKDLYDRDLVAQAMTFLDEKAIVNYGVGPIPFGESVEQRPLPLGETELKDGWKRSEEPCYDIDLATRKKMLSDFWMNIKRYVLPGVIVLEVVKNHISGLYHVIYQSKTNFVRKRAIECRNLVIATGKLSTSTFVFPFIPQYHHLGISVRLECSSVDPVWKQFECKKGVRQLWSRKTERYEWYTHGHVRKAKKRLSGITVTDRSTIDFHVRTDIPMRAREFIGHSDRSFCLMYTQYQQLHSNTFIARGLKSFMEMLEVPFPIDLQVIGIIIDEVGEYPRLDLNLKIPDERIWVAGDATGLMHDWMSSQVSGFYVGQQIVTNNHHVVTHKIIRDDLYRTTYPVMRSTGNHPSTHDIQLFIAYNDDDDVARFRKVVDEWNKENGMNMKMVANVMIRSYSKKKREKRVLYTSHEIRSDETAEVARVCHVDASYFTERGFDVVREKIDVTALSILGVPHTNEEAARFPLGCFDFRLCVDLTEGEITTDIKFLQSVSKFCSEAFSMPVPLSHEEGNDTHRYVNMRFRHRGSSMVIPLRRQVEALIAEAELKVSQINSKYVWYDSYPEYDMDWLDVPDLLPSMIEEVRQEERLPTVQGPLILTAANFQMEDDEEEEEEA